MYLAGGGSCRRPASASGSWPRSITGPHSSGHGHCVLGQDLERAGQIAGRVVVGAGQRDLVVVHARGRDGEGAVARAAAEQVHGAARRGHRDGELPRLRAADRLDHEVGAAALGELAHPLGVRWPARRLDRLGRAEAARRGEPLGVGVEHDRLGAGRGEQRALHQPERARAEHRRAVAGARATTSSAWTTQASGSASAAACRSSPSGTRCRLRSTIRGGIEHLLGEAAQQVQQVLAQALVPAGARAADPAGRRVAAEHAVAGGDGGDAGADRVDDARELVPEPRRVGRDRGVAAEHGLHVGAAAERRADAEHDLAAPRRRLGDGVDAQVARRVQDRGPHASLVTITFTPSRLRAAASASSVRSSGKRWVTRRSAGIAPRAIRSSAARVSCGPAE